LIKKFALLALLIAPRAFGQLPDGVLQKPVTGYPAFKLYERKPIDPLPSFWDEFFQLFQLPSGTKALLPFQRSVAVLVGIGHYQYISPKLEFVSKDVEKMRDFLLGPGEFDAVYVADEGVSPGVLDDFMSNYVPTMLKNDDRLLFYYSGHGTDPGTRIPVLEFQHTQPGRWGGDVLRIDEYGQWSGLIKAKHVLFLYDACTAGEAVARKGLEPASLKAVTELSGNGSRIVVTAGTAKQSAWVMEESSKIQYSLFTDALLQVLRNGTAESRTRGFITIEQVVAEATVVLALETSHLGPGHNMKPNLESIDSALTGTFVFLYPQARKPTLPESDIITMGMAVPKGVEDPEFEKQRELAYWNSVKDIDDVDLLQKVCDEFPTGLFCPVAQKRMSNLNSKRASTPNGINLATLSVDELKVQASHGSREALSQLGKAYELGTQGAAANIATSMAYYRQAAEIGDGAASFRLGTIYDFGDLGVAKNDAQAAAWYRKSADAGYAKAMTNLGFMYRQGRMGLPKDDVQAVAWYRKAADAGDGRGMSDLGYMYQQGFGGLPKDDGQAAYWYRRSANAGNPSGMFNLGAMYQSGRGGLPQDDVQAAGWYRKSADAGDAYAMTNLALMYENCRGGLPKDNAQAVAWYRKAADRGSEIAAAALMRLGANANQ